jgi:GAG-pre-integrase domain
MSMAEVVPIAEAASPTAIALPVSVPVACKAGVTESAVLWHRRLGHTGFSSLAKMAKQGLVTGLPVNAADFKAAAAGPVCSPCVLAKHARPQFPVSDSKSYDVLELLHMDVLIRRPLWVVPSILLHSWMIDPSFQLFIPLHTSLMWSR